MADGPVRAAGQQREAGLRGGIHQQPSDKQCLIFAFECLALHAQNGIQFSRAGLEDLQAGWLVHGACMIR
jgi:hypothetical protein